MAEALKTGKVADINNRITPTPPVCNNLKIVSITIN
jgi:hypothetical protein